ncbi:ZIP family zinc transporter [Sphingomonas sp. CFBP 13720]|nr:ZIP family zinc transporter [Sphingomonas sp. CFBP 13720]
MPLSIQAGLWGLLSGSALLIGAAIGWFVAMPRKAVAGIMAFGSGVLISALSFELMDEAWKQGGFLAVGIGFVSGATVYTALNFALAAHGARHRKRSDAASRKQHDAVAPTGNSASLALGALIDGVPESIVIGTSLLAGGAIGWVAVAAVFLSNLPEGLSSAAGARHEGKSAGFVFALWAGIALVAGLSSFAGFTLFDGASPQVLAAVQGVAAGAILAMIIDTMAPEAFEGTHDFAGLIAVFGFLTAFGLSKLA